MATTSTEGSRRANCPMPKQMMRQRKEIGAPNVNWRLGLSMGDIQYHPTSSNNWRTSLVPAPAVIPAPRAYINAVAVKGFVVELWVAKKIVTSIFFHLNLGHNACDS